MILLFRHGWGFDASLWDALRPLLPGFDHRALDEGWFAAPDLAMPEGPVLALTHSLGTPRLLADPPPGLAGLVAINGFTRFAARDGLPGVAPRVIERMERALAADPQAVVDRFRADCGAEPAPPVQDLAGLARGLADLRETEAPPARVPVLSLEGAQDHLLSPETRGAQFHGTAERHEQAGGGHLLPLTDAAWCAGHIRAFASRLAKSGAW